MSAVGSDGLRRLVADVLAVRQGENSADAALRRSPSLDSIRPNVFRERDVNVLRVCFQLLDVPCVEPDLNALAGEVRDSPGNAATSERGNDGKRRRAKRAAKRAAKRVILMALETM